MVYEELKMQILTGTIIPGTRMMEVELAEEMGVSRSTDPGSDPEAGKRRACHHRAAPWSICFSDLYR